MKCENYFNDMFESVPDYRKSNINTCNSKS